MFDHDEKAGSDSDAQVTYETPTTGWKGTYYKPLTQVSSFLLLVVFSFDIFLQVVMLGFVCFMGPGES